MSLQTYGWNTVRNKFNLDTINHLIPARITGQFRGEYEVVTEQETLRARIPQGKIERFDFLPAIGDWVGIRQPEQNSPWFIEWVMPRISKLSRKTAGELTEEQVIAANVDIVFIVTGLDSDYNVRRLERYVTAVWDSGAQPVIVLNKMDLHEDPEFVREEVELTIPGVKVLLISALDGSGIGLLRAEITEGLTACLVGSSGCGKSTLTNQLLGESAQKTGGLRKGDEKGKHTTTNRFLFPLPGGGAIIDNPGMREVQLWSDEESLERTFDDIATLAEDCRFADCTHQHEPGCAVQAAIGQGVLPLERYESYLKLQKEIRYLQRRIDQKAAQEEKQKWKGIAKFAREYNKQRRS